MDVAKEFLRNLRSNAAATKDEAVSTGLLSGALGFGDGLVDEVARMAVNTGYMVQLSKIGANLWTDFLAGRTTNATANVSYAQGFATHSCSVYQGTFPTRITADFWKQAMPALATSPANASYVGCYTGDWSLWYRSIASALDGSREGQFLVINMSADPSLAQVPYVATVHSPSHWDYSVPQVPKTFTFPDGRTFTYYEPPRIVYDPIDSLSGVARFGLDAQGVPTSFALQGDLPPVLRAYAPLTIGRYPIDIAGSVGTGSDGSTTIALSRGLIGMEPIGGTAIAFQADLSAGGASVAVLPPDDKPELGSVRLATKISNAYGQLSGTVLIDKFVRDEHDDLKPTHGRFDGQIAVRPVVDGKIGDLVPVINGSLEATTDALQTRAITGTLTLPNRPVGTLTATLTRPKSGTTAVDGRYVQEGLSVSISGTSQTTSTGAFTQTTRNTASFGSSTGVKFSVDSALTRTNLTVKGRQTAVIDRKAKTVTYADGTFESLF